MPQTFQVLRCYKCEVFQVHPTKKAKDWKCKLCNEKQSIKRFYGLGTGIECRIHVQKLNGIRGDIDNSHSESDIVSDSSNYSETLEQSGEKEFTSNSVAQKSKWLDYVNNEEKQQTPDLPMIVNNTEVVLELPAKRPRKPSKRGSTKEVCKPKTQEFENYSQASIFSNNCTSANPVKFIEEESSTKYHMGKVKNDAPIVNNSKWEKYIETQNLKSETNADQVSFTNSQSTLNATFQFQDEEDLDSVLDL